MRNYLLFVTALFFSIQAQSGETEQVPVAAVSAFAKPVLVGMQLSVRKGQQQGQVSAGVAKCVQSLDASSLNPLFLSLLTENLTKNELKATEDFFVTAVGRKYAKHGLMQVYTSLGEQPPEALPGFSEAEYKELENFSRTSAGEKLLVRKVLSSVSANQAISAHIQGVLKSCARKS